MLTITQKKSQLHNIKFKMLEFFFEFKLQLHEKNSELCEIKFTMWDKMLQLHKTVVPYKV